jgi:Rrf2 family transcriptional regulator, iron-sulfur cluster assembly transcription factor
MFLNQTSHYALRAMTCLTLSGSAEPVNSRQLAEKTGVPPHYLSKIMRKFVEAGYVISQKGHGGGFLIKKPLESIRIIDVLNASGFDPDDQPCVFGWDKCSDTKPCPLHPVWKRLKDHFKEWAFNTSMEDVRRENRLTIDQSFMKPSETSGK